MTTLPKAATFEYPASYAPLKEADLTKFFQHQAEVLAFLGNEGIALLNQEEPLTFEEWEALFSWAFQALNGFGSRHVQRFFEAVVERGINDLAHLVESTETDPDTLKEDVRLRGPLVGKWMASILYNLDPARIENSLSRRELFKKFSRVCVSFSQKIKEPAFLSEITQARFPKDSDTRKMWLEKLCAEAGVVSG